MSLPPTTRLRRATRRAMLAVHAAQYAGCADGARRRRSAGEVEDAVARLHRDGSARRRRADRRSGATPVRVEVAGRRPHAARSSRSRSAAHASSLQHPDAPGRAVRAAARQHRAHVRVRSRPSTRAAHIGNFRTFVCVDVLRRTLKYLCGYDVHERRQLHRRRRQDDRRRAEGRHAAARVHRRSGSTRSARTAAQLGIETPEETPRATDEPNLRAMGDMILALERNGHTYRRDGSIYFKIASLPTYGRLARLDHDGLHAGARVDVDEYSKDDARDFVLWKATKAGEPTLGLRHRARAGPAGTSSARRWRCGCSAGRRSTFTPAAST